MIHIRFDSEEGGQISSQDFGMVMAFLFEFGMAVRRLLPDGYKLGINVCEQDDDVDGYRSPFTATFTRVEWRTPFGQSDGVLVEVGMTAEFPVLVDGSGRFFIGEDTDASLDDMAAEVAQELQESASDD